MRVDDPKLLGIGAIVRRQRNGPLWKVKAIRTSPIGTIEVGVWHRRRGWRVFPFSGLILVSPARTHSSPLLTAEEGPGRKPPTSS